LAAYLNRARSPAQVILSYGELEEMLKCFCVTKVLAYSDEAEDRFVALRKQKVRVATLDLRIASIAIVSGATLLTRIREIFAGSPGYPSRIGRSEIR